MVVIDGSEGGAAMVAKPINRDYQRDAKANYDRLLRLLEDHKNPHSLRDAARESWVIYENFLDSYDLSNPDPKNTNRKRNRLFAAFLAESSLLHYFESTLLDLPEAQRLAKLQPQIFREERFRRAGIKDTHCHEAYSSDFDRYLAGLPRRESIPRLLDLLYVVRCNHDHGQKVLPKDWPEIRKRNAQIFELVVPIQRNIAKLLFENVWTDGVFVYGTCKPTEGNFKHIEHLVERVSDDWYAKGELYDLGKYPGLVPTPAGKVRGCLLEGKEPGELLSLMDELEGAAFLRELLWIKSEHEQEALAWVYCYQGTLEGVPTWPQIEWHS